MNKELKEQAYKEFDERFEKTEVMFRSKNGNTEYSTSGTELKDFIDSLIDKTVQYCRQNHRQNN